MITLGGVIIPDSLIWTDRTKWSPVAQKVKVTLGGLSVVRASSLLNGRPITLEGTETQGWIPKDIAEELQALADTPMSVLVFNFHGEFVNSVMFRHHEPQALELTPLVQGALNPDYFYGTIKLMTV